MAEGSVAREKSRAFALRVVKVCQYLQEQKREYVLSKQLLRSGTAKGALVREAEQAESRADFIHKLSIALKEASETECWLDLLTESGYFERHAGGSVLKDVDELLKLLTSIIKTTKSRR
ncbi:MAG: four helix bundle protein [Alcanivorax sp.]|uniref:four helix bundle protein n=1 Tax=Alcanivorax sp. TaxID=1872427 RepID=UPI0026382E0F|nr:four helix bundle protein [Alcanivorax sp.]MDF1725345.1 four helix bundle protein [Alcanivorax sp.]